MRRGQRHRKCRRQPTGRRPRARKNLSNTRLRLPSPARLSSSMRRRVVKVGNRHCSTKSAEQAVQTPVVRLVSTRDEATQQGFDDMYQIISGLRGVFYSSINRQPPQPEPVMTPGGLPARRLFSASLLPARKVQVLEISRVVRRRSIHSGLRSCYAGKIVWARRWRTQRQNRKINSRASVIVEAGSRPSVVHRGYRAPFRRTGGAVFMSQPQGGVLSPGESW